MNIKVFHTLLKGGTVFDPEAAVNQRLDIGIRSRPGRQKNGALFLTPVEVLATGATLF